MKKIQAEKSNLDVVRLVTILIPHVDNLARGSLLKVHVVAKWTGGGSKGSWGKVVRNKTVPREGR